MVHIHTRRQNTHHIKENIYTTQSVIFYSRPNLDCVPITLALGKIYSGDHRGPAIAIWGMGRRSQVRGRSHGVSSGMGRLGVGLMQIEGVRM